MIVVKKGNLTTKINERQFPVYEKNGWEIVIEKEITMASQYDSYTHLQLLDIGKARGMNFDNMTDKEIKTALVDVDTKKEMVNYRPSNKGFTDNLIIE